MVNVTAFQAVYAGSIPVSGSNYLKEIFMYEIL